MHQFISYGMANRHTSTDVETVLKVIEEMHLNESSVVYNYDILHTSPWAPHIEYEQRHRGITKVFCMKNRFHVKSEWQKNNEISTLRFPEYQ